MALSLWMAKEYTKDWDPKLTEQFFENYPKTKAGKIPYRIYIPLGAPNEGETKKYGERIYHFGNISPELRVYLKIQGYFIHNYDWGIARKYSEGHNKPTRFIKIGKLLKKNAEMKALFDNDPIRNMVKKTRQQKQFIVVSRHPVDIVGASTGRKWSSCIRVTHRQEMSSIYHEVKAGALVAYIVGEKDKNIEHPSARIMLRPWTSLIKGKKNFLAFGGIYGTCQPAGFTDKVREFLAEVNPKTGIFRRHQGSYNDGHPNNQGINSNFIEGDTFHIRSAIENFRDLADSMEWFTKTKFIRRSTQDMFRKNKMAFEILKTYRQMIGVPRMELACRMTRSQYRDNFWTINDSIVSNSSQGDIDYFFKTLKSLSKSLRSGKGQGSGSTKEHIINLKSDIKKVMKDIQEQKNLEIVREAA